MRPPIPLASWLTWPSSRAFFAALIECGEKGKWAPEHMLELIACECDFRSVRNKQGYQGLTQIGNSELRSFGWKPKDGAFYVAPHDVQIRRGTFPYFEQKRKNPICRVPASGWEDSAHLWHANLAPAHVGREDGLVYDRSTHRSEYNANARLDTDNDGVITREDLRAAIAVACAENHASMMAAYASLASARAEGAAQACL